MKWTRSRRRQANGASNLLPSNDGERRAKMHALFLFRTSMPAYEPERVEWILLNAMRATGTDVAGRGRVSIPNRSPHETFTVMVHGPDALDCHVYAPGAVGAPPVFPSQAIADRFPEINPCLVQPYAILGIEGSPPVGGRSEFRRVCLAAADLIDSETFAILDWATCRLIRVTLETATFLRSSDPQAAFADAVVVPKPWSVDNGVGGGGHEGRRPRPGADRRALVAGSRTVRTTPGAALQDRTIVDDAGVAMPIRWQLFDLARGSMADRDLAQVIASTPRNRAKSLALSATGFFGTFILINGFTGRSLARFDVLVPFLGAILGFVIVGALAVALIWLGRNKLAQRRTAAIRACIDRGRCPACWYDFSAVPASHGDNRDGLVTCPECAARWSLPRSRGGVSG